MSTVAIAKVGREPDGNPVWAYADDEQALFAHEVWCATGWQIADFDLWVNGAVWTGREGTRAALLTLRDELVAAKGW